MVSLVFVLAKVECGLRKERIRNSKGSVTRTTITDVLSIVYTSANVLITCTMR